MNKHILSAVLAYSIWGLFPIYFKAIQQVPALEIISHRITWSFIFLIFLITAKKEWIRLWASISNKRVAGIYIISAVLIGLNWLLYVWAINSEHIIESSLGYFINPLFSVALGVIVIRERLRPLQWLPIGLAALGVTYLAIEYGQLPWISLGLALTFGLYGMVKKLAPLGASHGLTVETGVLFIPAIGYLLFLNNRGAGAFGTTGWNTTLLLIGAGVATTIPLILYSNAARGLPLWVMGILQYIAPTMQFLLGVFAYGENFSLGQLIGYGIIWIALVFFTAETIIHWRNSTKVQAKPV